MTIARTLSGEVIGQEVGPLTESEREQDWLASQGRLTRYVYLLTRDGRYVTVPASSVRLEEV